MCGQPERPDGYEEECDPEWFAAHPEVPPIVQVCKDIDWGSGHDMGAPPDSAGLSSWDKRFLEAAKKLGFNLDR